MKFAFHSLTVLSTFFILLSFASSKKVWRKADLPQFRPKKVEKEPIPTGPRNRIVDWKNSLAFEKVTKESEMFCRVYNLCAHYSFGITVMNVLAKWKHQGLIFPYKKWDGKPDSTIPHDKVYNFVRTYHRSRESQNNPLK